MHSLHPGRRTAADGFGRRFSIGLSIALAFVLVAFEWRSLSGPSQGPAPALPDEGIESERLPVVIIQDDKPGEEPRKQRQAAGRLVPADPIAQDDGDEATAEEGAAEPVGEDPGAEGPPGLNPDEAIESGPFPWIGVEQRPYFKRCLEEGRDGLDACTERIIDQHLKRNFVLPAAMRREERTTVSVLIDAQGRIAEIICAPKPSPAVAAEIERVLRTLPPLNPATQNGRPVPVVFQLPFRVMRA